MRERGIAGGVILYLAKENMVFSIQRWCWFERVVDSIRRQEYAADRLTEHCTVLPIAVMAIITIVGCTQAIRYCHRVRLSTLRPAGLRTRPSCITRLRYSLCIDLLVRRGVRWSGYFP